MYNSIDSDERRWTSKDSSAASRSEANWPTTGEVASNSQFDFVLTTVPRGASYRGIPQVTLNSFFHSFPRKVTKATKWYQQKPSEDLWQIRISTLRSNDHRRKSALRNNSWDYQISFDGCPYRIRFLSTTLEYTRAYNR